MSPLSVSEKTASRDDAGKGVCRRLDYVEDEIVQITQAALGNGTLLPDRGPAVAPGPAQTKMPSRSPSPSLVTGTDGAGSYPLPKLQFCGAPAAALANGLANTVSGAPGPGRTGTDCDVPKGVRLLQRRAPVAPVPDTTLPGTVVGRPQVIDAVPSTPPGVQLTASVAEVPPRRKRGRQSPQSESQDACAVNKVSEAAVESVLSERRALPSSHGCQPF